jgi:hypothetical protein
MTAVMHGVRVVQGLDHALMPAASALLADRAAQDLTVRGVVG